MKGKWNKARDILCGVLPRTPAFSAWCRDVRAKMKTGGPGIGSLPFSGLWRVTRCGRQHVAVSRPARSSCTPALAILGLGGATILHPRNLTVGALIGDPMRERPQNPERLEENQWYARRRRRKNMKRRTQ